MIFDKTKRNISSTVIIILIALSFTNCKSTKWNIPDYYVSSWKTSGQKVSVRLDPKDEKTKIVSDTVSIIIHINKDKTVSGKIGTASFENAKLVQNSSKGLVYTVKCGKINKIFEKDPIEKKEVEMWLNAISGRIEAELYCKNGSSTYTMARFKLRKM